MLVAVAGGIGDLGVVAVGRNEQPGWRARVMGRDGAAVAVAAAAVGWVRSWGCVRRTTVAAARQNATAGIAGGHVREREKERGPARQGEKRSRQQEALAQIADESGLQSLTAVEPQAAQALALAMGYPNTRIQFVSGFIAELWPRRERCEVESRRALFHNGRDESRRFCAKEGPIKRI